MPLTFRPRRLSRPLTRRSNRRLTRRIGRGPRVNHLGHALRAFARAIRAHRRLIQLAPGVFDDTVVRREAAEQVEREKLRILWEEASLKVYGPTPPELHQRQIENWCDNGAETVRFSRRKTLAVEHSLAGWSLWLQLGKLSFARHQHLRPHWLPALGTIARLVDVATQLGRLGCGLDFPGGKHARESEGSASWSAIFMQDLERIHGDGNVAAVPKAM